MRTGQIVRFRPASPVARDWKIPPESLGTVVCSYELLARFRARKERIDVSFARGLTLWGRPAEDFEIIPEDSDPAKAS